MITGASRCCFSTARSCDERTAVSFQPSANTNNETGKAKNLADERLESDKRQQQRKEEEVKQQAKAEEDKKKCIDAQGQLRLYTDSPRLTVPDGAGGIAYADDDMRQKKIAEANKVIAAFCK